MASPEAILQALKAAAASGDGHKLKEAYAAITASLASQSTFRAGLESLVVCAEAAIQVSTPQRRIGALPGRGSSRRFRHVEARASSSVPLRSHRCARRVATPSW